MPALHPGKGSAFLLTRAPSTRNRGPDDTRKASGPHQGGNPRLAEHTEVGRNHECTCSQQQAEDLPHPDSFVPQMIRFRLDHQYPSLDLVIQLKLPAPIFQVRSLELKQVFLVLLFQGLPVGRFHFGHAKDSLGCSIDDPIPLGCLGGRRNRPLEGSGRKQGMKNLAPFVGLKFDGWILAEVALSRGIRWSPCNHSSPREDRSQPSPSPWQGHPGQPGSPAKRQAFPHASP